MEAQPNPSVIQMKKGFFGNVKASLLYRLSLKPTQDKG